MMDNKNHITKILYGIDVSRSIDVTSKITERLATNGCILASDNINEIIGCDPYIGVRKFLFIYYYGLDEPFVMSEFGGNLDEDLLSMGMGSDRKVPNILFYLLVHDDESYSRAVNHSDKPYIKIIRLKQTKYFESVIWNYLKENRNEWEDKDYVGILTHSFEMKIRIAIHDLYKRISRIINKGDSDPIDVFTYSACKIPCMLSEVMCSHPKMAQIYDHMIPKVFNADQSKLIDYSVIPFYSCNYWIAKKDMFARYVDFAVEFMRILDDSENVDLQSMVYSDANYPGNLRANKLLELCGLPFYTHHPFVMERLPSIFFWANGATMKRV